MQTSNKTIRVLLADDHQVVRVGLRTILDSFPMIKVVGEAGTLDETVQMASSLKPDIVLLDVRMPEATSFESCRQILAENPDSRVIFLTSFADDTIIFEAITAGADGYLLKDIEAEELVRAIEQVANGQSILDPSVTRRVLGRVKAGAETPVPSGLEILSAQEKRVLALVAQGKTNKEIGLEMGLSDKTVKNYLSNLLDKLKLSRRSQAAAYFVQHSK